MKTNFLTFPESIPNPRADNFVSLDTNSSLRPLKHLGFRPLFLSGMSKHYWHRLWRKEWCTPNISAACRWLILSLHSSI